MDFFIKNKKTGEYWSEKKGWLKPDRGAEERTKHNDTSKQLVSALPRHGEWEEIRTPRFYYYFRQSPDVKFVRYHRGRGVACNVIIEAESTSDALKKARLLQIPIENSPDGQSYLTSDNVDYNRWGYISRGLSPMIKYVEIKGDHFKEVPQKPNERNHGYIHYLDGSFKFFSM